MYHLSFGADSKWKHNDWTNFLLLRGTQHTCYRDA